MKTKKLILFLILFTAFLFASKGFVNAQEGMGVPDSGDGGGFIPQPTSGNGNYIAPTGSTNTSGSSAGSPTGAVSGSPSSGSYVPPYVPPAGSGGISASIGGGTPFSMDTPVGIASDTTTSIAPCFPAGARYDTNSDNVVSQTDLNALLQVYFTVGSSTAPLTTDQTKYDINGDGKITATDFSVLYAHYGQHACAMPTPTGIVCAEVITSARNNSTHTCQTFPTSCLPTGWTSDTSCNGTPVPTADPSCPLHSHGDANCDGKIDTDDFNIWRSEYLSALATPTGTIPDGAGARPYITSHSDFNQDGKINTDDFSIWHDGLLSSLGNTSTPTPIANISTIPTPTPTVACTPKPTGCGTFWDFVNPTCTRPAGSTWCPVANSTITPSPTPGE